MKDDRTRESLVPPLSLMATPGVYSVKLKAGDVEQTQSFELLKDPNTEGSLSDILAQKELLDKIRADYEEISTTVNEAERLRRQLRDLMPMVSGDVLAEVKSLDSVATSVENQMIQLKHTGKGQDAIRLPGMIAEKLGYLASTVAIGDFKPADPYMEVYTQLHAEWLAVQKAWEQIKNENVDSMRDTMKENQVGPLIFGED